MPNIPNHPAMRPGPDAQFNVLTDLTRRSYDSMRKLNEINLQFAQQLMQDATDATRSMLGCTDAFQLAAAAARASQPAAEHLRNYQQQLLGVLTGAQLELARSAESLLPEAGRHAGAMAERLARDSDLASDAASRAARDGSAESRGYGGNGAHHTPG